MILTKDIKFFNAIQRNMKTQYKRDENTASITYGAPKDIGSIPQRT